MARIVAVHGIGQQRVGEHSLRALWLPALRDGLKLAGGRLPEDQDLAFAAYGELFRPRGRSAGVPPYDEHDVEEGLEQELLELWWREAARVDAQIPGPERRTRLRTPQFVQRALYALSQSRFFGDVALGWLIFDLKQVRRYLTEEAIRQEIQRRVEEAVQEDTRVLISHSLGSVVAYEALCAHPEWPVHTLITLGSPLGIPHLIFDRLRPAPSAGMGVWPGGVENWVNVADAGDVVALVKALQPLFGGNQRAVEDYRVDNGVTAHNVEPYLTAVETGCAVARALAKRGHDG